MARLSRLDAPCVGRYDFVQLMPAHAKEHFERYYELQRLGYDLKTVAEKAALIYGIESVGIQIIRIKHYWIPAFAGMTAILADPP
jgi:hypothetical protein